MAACADHGNQFKTQIGLTKADSNDVGLMYFWNAVVFHLPVVLITVSELESCASWVARPIRKEWVLYWLWSYPCISKHSFV